MLVGFIISLFAVGLLYLKYIFVGYIKFPDTIVKNILFFLANWALVFLLLELYIVYGRITPFSVVAVISLITIFIVLSCFLGVRFK